MRCVRAHIDGSLGAVCELLHISVVGLLLHPSATIGITGPSRIAYLQQNRTAASDSFQDFIEPVCVMLLMVHNITQDSGDL